MLDYIPFPGYSPNNQFTVDTLLGITMSFLTAKRNGTWQFLQCSDTPKLFVGNVGAGATQAVWTPTAGTAIQLQHLLINAQANFVSLQILFGATVVIDLSINSGSFLDIPFGFPGHFIYPINTVLNVKNNTGLAGNVSVSAFGNEVST